VREIEEAAKKKREADGAAEQEQARRAALMPARIERAQRFQRGEVFNQSLGGGKTVEMTLTFICLGIVGGVGAFLDIYYRLSGWLEYLVIGVGATLAIGLLFFVQDFVRAKLARARMKSFVASLPGFDGAAYEEAISENRRHAALTVRLEFTGSWPSSREDAVDAVMNWVPLKSAAWEDDALVLQSEEFATTDRIRGRGVSYKYFTNFPVHACFSRIAREVVPKLSAAAPIRRVGFTIQGQIEPWDTKL
jgi:hypothetical protein